MPLILLNPHAGAGRAAALEPALRAALAAAWPGARMACPDTAAAAGQLIAGQPRGSRIVLVGGDGTLNQLLPALLAGNHEVGLVPAGSGDDIARAIGVRGLPWRDALEHALSAPPRAVDIGLAVTEHETRPFLSSLAAGFDAAVAARAVRGPRWLVGLPRYLLATLREVAHLQLNSVQIQADGLAVHAGPVLFASVLNTATYGGGMPAVPGARIDDGQLDLLLAGHFGRAGTLAMLPRLLVGRHLGHPWVHSRRFAALVLQAPAALALAADGEPMAAACTVTVHARPGALVVVTRR